VHVAREEVKVEFRSLSSAKCGGRVQVLDREYGGMLHIL